MDTDWTFFELRHWYGYSHDELADTTYDERVVLIDDLSDISDMEAINETNSN